MPQIIFWYVFYIFYSIWSLNFLCSKISTLTQVLIIEQTCALQKAFLVENN